MTHPIRIKLRLRKSQKVGENLWKVTIAGAEKTHTDEWVIYRAKSFDVALRSFDANEVISALIENEDV